MKSIAMVVHNEKPLATEAATALVSACVDRGVEANPISGDELPAGVDAVVGVGGDGTVLRAAALAMAAQVPVAGINVGRVGYLAEFATDEIGAFVDALASGLLRVFSVMTVGVRGPGFEAIGVNDVVIEKVVSERIIEIGVV